MDLLGKVLSYIGSRDHEERVLLRTHAFLEADHFATLLRIGRAEFLDALMQVEPEDEDASLMRQFVRVCTAKPWEWEHPDKRYLAMAAANEVGRRARWRRDRAHFSFQRVISTVITDATDLLVFEAEDFSVSVPMRVLIQLGSLGRSDLRACVSASGLEVKWGMQGSFLFPSAPEPCTAQIVLPLPARATGVA